MTNRTPLPLQSERIASPATTRRPMHVSGLVDTFGRRHDNLRVSVTDRCNLRCTYCMPEEVEFRPKEELLTFEEIARFVRVAACLGVSKVRLTGGEPLLRRELHKLVQLLVGVDGIHDLGMTTNGLLLKQQAKPLFESGLRRLNVSLDTLDAERFRIISRRDGLAHVMEGLTAAKNIGFDPIKINAVSIRGFSEPDVVPLAEYARAHGFELRFIEYMPIGSGPWERDKVLPAAELIERLSAAFGPLMPDPANDPRAPAQDYLYADGQKVGIIASVTRPFCGSCNRIRLTADGKVRNCLFALDETDVRPYLRDEPNEAAIADVICDSVWAKWAGHEFNTARFIKPERTMHTIGG